MIKIDLTNLTATKENGEVIRITKTQARLLEIMYNNRNKVLKYKELSFLLSKTVYCSDELARTHIWQLNNRLGFKLISSRGHIGIGYKLNEEIYIENILPEAVRFASECYELKAEDVLSVYNTWVELKNNPPTKVGI